jgi:ADP-heptose:LPS heptosyltransferase
MADIVIAPFSNSDIRDWPAGSFQRLIECLQKAHSRDGLIRVIGAGSQTLRAREIVRSFSSDRVRNDCGRPWREVVDLLHSAACVVGNNSGVAHLAARIGRPTVCIFSGAHQRIEWRPLGRNVVVLSRAIACAPCHLHRAADCPFGKACLEQITPETVSEAVLEVIDRQRRIDAAVSGRSSALSVMPSRNIAVA